MSRVERIRAQLTESLRPLELEVVDDSAAHLGHAGARDGRGHFRVRLVSPMFSGLSPVARHRLVYASLGGLMHDDIHALQIEARCPGE